MKKAFSIILAVLLVLAVVVSCNYDNLVDDMFGFVVTFDANGGTGTMESQRYTMEGGKLPANTFTYDGHLFGYWNTQKDGKGDSYGDGETVTFSQDTVLYAVWFIELTADTTELVAGKTYVNVTDDLSLTNRLSIRGDAEPVTIILRPDTVLKATKGIGVYGKQELIIDGPGKLVATGTDGNAGIGGVNEDDKRDAGTIYILDGIVVAEGSENAAGIGGGRNASGGIIVIDGGEVIALGGKDAAGIGSGAKTGSEEVNGGMITISGGYVLAVGGSHDDDDSQGGAGIGGGRNADSGDIAIGGTAMIRANGGGSKANGIGVGKGDGTPEEKAIEIDGVTIEVSEDGTTWTDYTGNNRNRFMKSYTLVSITFDANGATGGTPMDPQEVHTGVATTLNANTYENPGLFFFAWNTKADGSGTSYVNEGSITVEEDTTLYAQWSDAIPIDENTTTLTGGYRYTIAGVLISNSNRLTIDGSDDVTLILPAGMTLNLTSGISVGADNSLIIDGEGTLYATGAELCAAIGGTDTLYCGNITIKGGTVNANGGFDGAGIGAGAAGGASGTVSILGGTVNANGGTYGAGIGGGYNGSGMTVVISGGEVTATGDSEHGAHGVGRGYDYPEPPVREDKILRIGDGLGLYGGADKDHAPFLNGPTGTESYTGDRYAYMETKETTIGPTSPTITFNPNPDKGGQGTEFTQVVPSGVEAQLAKNIFTHASQDFIGWNTKPDGSGTTTYPDKATVTLTGDLTLYAIWGSTFTVSKSTVIANRQQNVVTDKANLPSSGKYVMVATKPVYSDAQKTVPVTTVSGSGTWKYVAYNGGNGFVLDNDTNKVYYKEDKDTQVTVIYLIGKGVWNGELPPKDLMSNWGEKNSPYNEYDENLYTALGFGSGDGVWSGTEEGGSSFCKRIKFADGYHCWVSANSTEEYGRVQSAIFQ